MKDLVAEQTREWSDMVSRQMTEEHELRKAHVQQQCEVLKSLMEQAQSAQLKELETRQDKWVLTFDFSPVLDKSMESEKAGRRLLTYPNIIF